MRDGLCACGCGGRTPVATGTDRRRGQVKGQPLKFIFGHANGGDARRCKDEQRLVRSCVICGAEFRLRKLGPEQRSTCSPRCMSLLLTRSRLKGEALTPESGRQRARRITPLVECQRCGQRGKLEVHHRDRNPVNNDPSNLETLCVPCHKAHHRMPPKGCEWCKEVFQPRQAAQKYCGRRCSGTASAAIRSTRIEQKERSSHVSVP